MSLSISYPCSLAILSLISHSSLIISSDILSYSHQFLRRAYFRHGILMQVANSSHDRLGFGVVKMPAIPRQQVVDSMHRGYGKMNGIILCSGRYRPRLQQRLGKRYDWIVDHQYRNTGNRFKTPAGCFWVSPSCLLQGDSRRIEVESGSLCLPPVYGGFLPRGGQQVVRGASRQIRHDGCFDVYRSPGRCHVIRLLCVTPPPPRRLPV